MTYVVLLRGVNVGGKNKLPMAQLRADLEAAGFTNVRTYIASGNVLLDSPLSAAAVAQRVTEMVGVDALVLTGEELAEIIEDAPEGFGSEPEKYHYDVCFFLDIGPDEVMKHVRVHPDADTAVAGDNALYFRRLSALRTKSRMSSIAGTPVYGSLTIRNWNTTSKLLAMLD